MMNVMDTYILVVDPGHTVAVDYGLAPSIMFSLLIEYHQRYEIVCLLKEKQLYPVHQIQLESGQVG